MNSFLNRIASFFSHPSKDREGYAHEDKSMREHLTESEIDKTLKDSFPASDPPAWY